ncbi:hypothetical protein CAPTEDRAFT_202798 [Capitella teleta]|uniref:2-oxo-4-hydroxy-4-carboxy-5-ureidoimidazoline decarboxylase n=1 Tax=Capitella teleta TaxID=283909 RepID=R7URN9_CAPTE|nr:hypothetical protein CAPTEDRAFT_202798 [Capitella teleta]|eukprot:ELU09184.1 hypothetical protein CAPTEDRAFT_202798 [Capitella teleta]
MSEQLNIDEVNELDFISFVSRFGNVVESCPIVAAAVCQMRPFRSRDAMFEEICATIDGMSKERKYSYDLNGVRQGILMCHPDLAGKLACRGELTADSTAEQSRAGLLNLTAEEFRRLTTFNDEYKRKFGFPFVICVGENKKAAIFEGIERRLKNSAAEELHTGVEQVKRIINLRLNNLVSQSKSSRL